MLFKHLRVFNTTLFVTLVLMVLFFATDVFSAEILKVKGRYAVVKFTPEEAGNVFKGQKYYAVLNSKKKAILSVKLIKGNKAVLAILKGKARSGYTLIERQGKSTRGKTKVARSKYSTGSRKLFAGILVGASMDDQSFPDSQTKNQVETSGTGMSFKLVGDYSFYKRFGLRLQLGLEQFNAASEDKTTETNINYIGLDGILRYRITDSRWVSWFGIGLSVMHPLSPEPKGPPGRIILKDSITTQAIGIAQLGLQIPIGKNIGIPIQFEYLYFPPSKEDDIKTSAIAAKLGLGWYF